eukprot:395720_1
MNLLKVPTTNNNNNRSKSATITSNSNIKNIKSNEINILPITTPSVSISPSTSIKSSKYLKYESETDLSIYQTIQEMQNEILYLKILQSQSQSQSQSINNINLTIDEVDNELLDVDQYLILDKEWINWTYLEIVEWITNLEYGRYNKYKIILFANMKKYQFEGKFLPKLDKIDLSNFFGIMNFGDLTDLHKQIQRLIKT